MKKGIPKCALFVTVLLVSVGVGLAQTQSSSTGVQVNPCLGAAESGNTAAAQRYQNNQCRQEPEGGNACRFRFLG